MLRNTPMNYGSIAILMHWLVALLVIFLFALGYWMVGLNYYDAWYNFAPNLHKGAGVLLCVIMIFRLIWHFSNRYPLPIPNHSQWVKMLAKFVHLTLVILVFSVIISGYLISTANGEGIDVFGLFELPAIVYGMQNQEDIAGEVHELFSLLLIGIVVLHALAALKHHFIDHDHTLTRMLRSDRGF